MTYEGWTNYETWAVNLWLSNDEGSYDYVLGLACEALDDEDVPRALEALAVELKEDLSENSPLAGEASVYSDLLGAALDRVEWREIADHWIRAADEERAAL
jgi:hypothetical protein